MENQLENVVDRLTTIVAKIARMDPDRINRYDNLIELGADSVILTEVNSYIRKEFRVDIPITQFFEQLTTIADISEHILPQLDPDYFEPQELPLKLEHPISTAADVPHNIHPVGVVHAAKAEAVQTAVDMNVHVPALMMQMPDATLSSLFAGQLEIMNNQLRLLSGNQVAATTMAPTPAVQAQSVHHTAARHSTDPSTPERNVTPDKKPAEKKDGYKPYVAHKSLDLSVRANSEKQQEHIQELMKRYTAKTQSSKQFAAKYRMPYADCRNIFGFRRDIKEMVYQLVFKDSQGSRITDIDGNSYIDLTMDFGATLFGHNADFIKEAIAKEFDKGFPLSLITDLSGEVAEMICEFTGVERVSFFNSGTEAVMVAMRLARAATGKNKVVMFAGSYHGTFDGVLGMHAMNKEGKDVVKPIAVGVPQSMVDDIYILDYDDPASITFIKEHADELAAVLVEPVQSRRPDLQPRAFLHELRQVTADAGITLIFDEMILGFRLGAGGAQELFGVQADLVTFGKVVGGGMPIGIVAGKQSVMNCLDGGVWNYGDDSYPPDEERRTFAGGTFCHHPLAMAAAKAVLLKIKQEKDTIYPALNARTKHLADTLNAFFKENQVPVEILYCGSLLRFALRGNMEMFYYHLLDKGVYIWEGRNCFLSASHTDEDIEQVIKVVKETCLQMKSVFFLTDKTLNSHDIKTSNPLALNTDQQKMLAAEYINQGSKFFLPVLMQVEGELDYGLLNKALAMITARHEALRYRVNEQLTEFRIESDPLHRVNVIRTTQDTEADSILELVNQAFDLMQGPLFKIYILESDHAGSRSVKMLINAHHLIADGWSMSLLIEELVEAYNSLMTGGMPRFSEVMSFREYRELNEQTLQTLDKEKMSEFWRSYLYGCAPALQLPHKKLMGVADQAIGERLTYKADETFITKARKLAAAAKCSTFTVLLSAYQIMLHFLSDQDEFAVGVPVSGQQTVSPKALIGSCNTIMPLVSQISAETNMSRLVKQNTKAFSEFEKFHYFNMDALELEAAIQQPLLNVMFNMDREPQSKEFIHTAIALIPLDVQDAKYDLFFNLMEFKGELVFDIDFNSSLFTRETVARWLQLYLDIVEQLSKDPNRPLHSLHLFREEDARVTLSAGNHTDLASLEKNLSIRAADFGIVGSEFSCSIWSGEGKPVITSQFGELYLGRNQYESFNTGWVARITLDAKLELAGPQDRFFVRDGQRCSLWLIEQMLRDCPLLAEAQVTYDDIHRRIEADVAFVQSEPSLNHLMDWCHSSLPKEMIPDQFYTADKDAGRTLLVYERQLMTAVEETLFEMVSGLLGSSQFRKEDNLFVLGMNSLKVLNLVSQIEGHYGGIRIPLARLVMSLSVEGIAGIVGEMNQSEQVSPSRAISPIADQPYYETSSAQKRMYIVHQLQPESINYNLPFIVKVTGSLDIEKFNRALSLIVSRHENLRANFDQIEGEIVQFIKAAGAVQLEMLGEREAANDEAWLSGIQKEFIRPFDLQKDSLMRAGAAKLGDNEWILLFDFHHIIFDGASGLVFAQELMAAYNGLALLPLKCQYKDFVYWHNELLHSEEIKTQEAYWQNRFNDELPVSSIPTDFPRPLSRSYAGNIVTHQLDGNIKQMITEFCKEHACTPYAFFISILKVLVSRYSMQPEVIVGTLVEGRNHTDLQSLIGMFVNTLPIRSTVEPERPFSEFVRAVQHLAMNAFSNSDLPFERISQLAGVKSEGSRNPVFDILFSYQNFGSITMEAEDVNFEFQELLTDDCKFDINFEIFELEDGYSVAVEYSTELYMQDTIASLIQHFEVMLHSALADPKLSCGAIEILTTAEKNRLLLDFNHTAVEIPKDKLIIDLFEEQVAKCPGKKAVICGDEITTYIELDAIANKAAHQLLCRGISQGDIVAVSLERSTNLIAAILGILKCGAAFLPLADDYPEDRKQFVAADSEAKLIITERVSESFTVNGCQQITVDELLEGENTTRPILHKDSFKQLCYCIYTSGSTGTPKGVKITNGNLLNYLVYCRKEFVNGDPVMPLFSNIAFDLTMTSLFLPLCSGGQIHVYSKGMETDLHDIVSNPDLNVIKLTPSHLKLITSAFHDLSVMTNVQSLIVGGEELESRTAEETLRKLGRHIAIHNEYGPTETTIGCCDYVYQTDMDQARRTVLIGKPIDNTQTYVLQGNQLCGVGMIGELCIGGLGVGKGYLNRPELTQAKFIDSPFKEGEVLYRTGDLAKWQPDGNLEYLGRIDEQIKIRGHRIEPGDIEEAIRQHIGVKDAAVIVREDQTGDKLLCAYVVKEDTDTQVTIGQLKHDIRKYLPAYMVPAVFTFIEQLPVTSNGKLDRRALPAPTLLDRDDCILPRNEQEECLVHIFKEVLALEQISIDDNFFEMGGHSLRAVRLINLIEEKTGTRLSLKTIFDRPTVIGLSEVLNNGVENRYEKIPQAEKKRSYPMSSQQKRLYIIQEFDETQTAYNVPGAIEIKGKLEPERIKAIFEQLSQRHESLRTSFHMIAGELEQHIHDAIELDFCVTETDQLEKLDASDVLKEFIRPFDLGKAPLFRIQLLQDGADRSLFLFDMHHLISDGMTINIIMKEFSRIYNGEQLQPLEIQYKDYSEWMRQKDIQAQETYWLQQFSDQIPVLDLPLDYPRPQIQQFSGSNIDSKLDNEIFAGLQKLCKHTAVTEYMVLLSAFMVLFSKYSRQEDIIIGTPVSGRVHQDTEHVLGMFVNTLAMRGRPAGDKAFVELLDEVKDMCIKGFENQEYPFENLVEKLDVKRDMSRNPIFDVLFVFQNTEEEQFTAEGLEFGEIITESGIAKFDLTITVNTTPEGYAVNWEYGNHLFNEATIQRMAVHYEHILQAVMLQPTTKIRDIEMISWPEKQQILSDFNNTFTPYDLERNVFRLFEQWAEETPEKTAVKYGDREVSYRELNQKANQLAQYLLSLNLKDENIAGIMLERTPEMIQSMLGIWKAGGAYLPLDVSHPLQRRLDILNEANVQYVVTLSSYATPELLHQYEGNVICLDLIEDQLQALEHDNIEKAIEPFSLAYILFTSGSTGKPKGVMIEHAGMLNHILAERDMLGLDEHLVFAQNANHCFDISVWQMVGALALGGTTVIYSNEMVLEPRAFVESVVKDHVTLLEVVPSYLSVMMDCLEEDKLSLPNLKHLMITGEAVKPHLLTRWSTLGFEVPIVNAYGPAEASDDISQYVISGIVPDHMTSVPIGQPLHNIRIYILDPYGNLCPVGVTGELCVAGVAVGRGYVNDKLRTDQVFTADPFQQWLAPQWAPFQRMYRTGDLARWLPDGTIDYWGRMDEQVKVRGYRIELGEIEAVLRRQPEIKDVAVITRQESSGEQYICAYLVPKELGRGLNVEQIKSEIRKYLPEYMIPSYLMALDELPVTSNGKLDRKALPEPSDWGHRVIIAPRNPLEDMLTGVFKEVLGLEEVSIDDSFFELGGHSLKAAKVVNLIESITGIRLPLRTLFERPTVAAIGELLSEQGPRSFEPIPAAAIKRDYPMSSAQKRLYVIHQMDDLGTVYNMPGVLKLEGKLDPARIQAAFQELVRRHESLRTSFHMIEGELLQRIEEHAE
ncbi:amino acid adenylation domain-containing protein, partial [Paenibacillus cellulosilyticus]